MKESKQVGPRLSLCSCGHTGNTSESQHAARYVAGHGPCTVEGCACRQFTWVQYVDIAPTRGGSR